jgi:hypothetical protein
MLHDATDANALRIPFAQIRGTGAYGPLLEKCTETDYRRRFPTVAALRAALYDIWAADTAPDAGDDDGDALAQVQNDPDSPELWRRLIQAIESSDWDVRDLILRAVNSELLLKLHAVDDVLFSRMVGIVCTWASEQSFVFDYCDVVGDRLLAAYKVGNVRLKCNIVLAGLELSVSHNRWHVMHQAGSMLGATADDGLIDRILIEIRLDPKLELQLRRIERTIHWFRQNWHERIAAYLNGRDSDK